ncbi:3696_t:CDS:2, partial [Dentiscutata erythropus]
NHINKNCTDGVCFMTDIDKFQLVYFEGSRPAEKKPEREITDAKKIPYNLKNLYSNIIKEVIKNCRRLPKKLFMFGGQRKFRLNEIDNANLPREFLEMQNFIYFYEYTVNG